MNGSESTPRNKQTAIIPYQLPPTKRLQISRITKQTQLLEMHQIRSFVRGLAYLHSIAVDMKRKLYFYSKNNKGNYYWIMPHRTKQLFFAIYEATNTPIRLSKTKITIKQSYSIAKTIHRQQTSSQNDNQSLFSLYVLANAQLRTSACVKYFYVVNVSANV